VQLQILHSKVSAASIAVIFVIFCGVTAPGAFEAVAAQEVCDV